MMLSWIVALAYGMDTDGDGIDDVDDNCTFVENAQQVDVDLDGWGDRCDNCPTLVNVDQDDRDQDGFGNACDRCVFRPTETNDDTDDDGVGDDCDNCPDAPNFDQADEDEDGIGDACDEEFTEPTVQCGPSLPAVPWLAVGLLGVVLRRRTHHPSNRGARRMAAGVVPVHPLKARKNELVSS